MSKHNEKRRVVLKTFGVGLLGSMTSCASGGPVDVGVAAEFEMNSLQIIQAEGIIVGRDAGGLYAMTAICTHDGCDISEQGKVSQGVITCNCHGAQFDSSGTVTRGPARRALEHYLVEIDSSGRAIVQVGEGAANGDRTPV